MKRRSTCVGSSSDAFHSASLVEVLRRGVSTLWKMRFASLALPLIILLLSAGDRSVGAQVSQLNQSLQWLRSQIVPNGRVPAPHPQRRGLPLSYAPAKGEGGSLYSKSFTYDDALAAIAFDVAGETTSATTVLDALVRVQRDNGSFWFSYSVDSGWPEEGDHDMAVVRTGANSWVGYALAFHLQTAPVSKNPAAARQRQRYLASARRLADFVLNQRDPSPGLAQGLFKGGMGTVDLKMTPGGKEVVEIYNNEPVVWTSTEHNISSYFFLTALSGVTQEERYLAASKELRSKLMSNFWKDELGQFVTGVAPGGVLNRDIALDCASWGSLFLISINEIERAKVAVATADRLYENEHRGIRGHRPYHAEPIFTDRSIQRLLLPDAPIAQWKDIQLVWSEGSLGVALAHLRLGNIRKARETVDEIEKMRVGGGIRYSTRQIPYNFSGAASVAGTAWHIIVAEELKNPKANGFWNP